MTSTSVSVAADAAASLPIAPGSVAKGRCHRQGGATSSSASRARPSASMRRCCARRWKAPLAPPMLMADGTGKQPTTPARRRPSCSFASSVRPCAPRAVSSGAMLPMLAKIAGLLPTHTRRSEESEALQQFQHTHYTWACGEHRGCDHASGHRSGAFGRHGPARDPGRAVRCVARS